ncbi:unnamed protein product [Macrosiphum euphorbiae]|uniref:Uncharacterized protein n=1 Tax=Macrosiphum euphorbiae TaxID=13131 RepID=A0AAV0VLW6_9HEMI|nr:unnamed protein product [Macrosiphum euphorbiae]
MATTLQAMSPSHPSSVVVAAPSFTTATQVSRPNSPNTIGDVAGGQLTPCPTCQHRENVPEMEVDPDAALKGKKRRRHHKSPSQDPPPPPLPAPPLLRP